MMSTRLTLHALDQPTGVITALVELLKAFELETTRIINLNQYQVSDSCGQYLEELFRLGKEANNNMSNECKTALDTFKSYQSMLTIAQRHQLQQTTISIESSMGGKETVKFSDLLNTENKSECFFRTQIYLWQMVLGSERNTVAVPEIIRKLADLLLYRFQDPDAMLNDNLQNLNLSAFELDAQIFQSSKTLELNSFAASTTFLAPRPRRNSTLVTKSGRSLIGGCRDRNHPYAKPAPSRSSTGGDPTSDANQTDVLPLFRRLSGGN